MAPAEQPFVAAPAGPVERTGLAAAAAAEHWRLPSPVLLRSGMTAIYTAGAAVLRVAVTTAPTEAGLDLAAVLEGAGLRVPRPVRADVVRVTDLSVTAWERLVPVEGPVDWRAVGAMVARVHGLEPGDVPAAYPVPAARTFPWWQFDDLLAAVGDDLDPSARAGIDAAIERFSWWTGAPDVVLCHGDVHPGNVMATAAGPVLLDWDLLATAPPAWDHAMLVRVERWGGDPTWYDDFARGYGAGSWREDPLTAAIAELRLVAATLMRLVAARADPTAAAEAHHRLAYWRGAADAPAWHAV